MNDAVNQEKGKRKEFLGDLMNHHQTAKTVPGEVNVKAKSIKVNQANMVEGDATLDTKGRAKTVQEANNRESIDTTIKHDELKKPSKQGFVEDGDITSVNLLDKNVVFDENIEDGTVDNQTLPRQSMYKSGYSKFYNDLQLSN